MLRRDLVTIEGATKANVVSHLSGLWCFAVAGQSLTPEHIRTIRLLQPVRVIVALDREDNANTDRVPRQATGPGPPGLAYVRYSD